MNSQKPHSTPSSPSLNRRQFLQRGGALAAGATVAASLGADRVFAAEDNTIRLALIGCGGRGTGAVSNALTVKGQGPVQLHAMADLVEDRMLKSLATLRKRHPRQVDVPRDRRFIGFDAYRKAIDILRPGDVALCTTRAYIRPVHVEYAVSQGVNVFMEKPFSPDPGGLKRMLRAGAEAERKGVKIAAGLQCRHSRARQALIEKIRAGEMGDITLIRANRWGGASWLKPQGDKANDFLAQLQFGKVHLFWVGSGHMVDNLIHQIDECCWIKGEWPVEARGMGGRVPCSEDCGQNIDVYSMEYVFRDGTRAFCGFRRMRQAQTEFATFIHGTKCAAQFSGRIHAATVHLYQDQRIQPDNLAWTPTKDAFSPWQYEWNDFIESIRLDRPHNEAKRAVYSDLTSLMGRAAAHLNTTVTLEQVLKSDFQFCDYLDDLDYNSPVPVKPDAQGRFPVPIPGKWTEL
jgi:predicted dehydrogenase